MRSFEGQGLIRRRQGVGTFVVAKVPILDSGLEVLESIETLAQRINLSVNMGELQVEQVEADQDDAAALNVPVGTFLTRVARVIYTENRPIAYLVDTLPADILPIADIESGFTGSVLDLLLHRGDPLLVQSRTDIRAIGASQDVARALQIQRDDVLLHFVVISCPVISAFMLSGKSVYRKKIIGKRAESSKNCSRISNLCSLQSDSYFESRR